MVDMMRKTTHLKLPVLPGMYDSSYRKDYQWPAEYKPRKEKMQKLQIADAQLKAKDFSVPWERKVGSYSNNVDWQKREGLPAISIKASSPADDAGERKVEGSASGPSALQERKDATLVLPAIESHPPKYHSATKLAATQAEKSEKPQTPAELKNEPSHCPGVPAVTQTSGTAGPLLHREKMAPSWASYQQFLQKTYEATKRKAQQNRDRNLSVLVGAPFDRDWRSTYNRDFQRCDGPYGEHRKANKNLSHLFREDDTLNKNDWVSEYEESYSIFLKKRHQLSQTPSAGLCLGLSSGKGF